MSCFNEILFSVSRRRRDAPLSRMVVKVACLQDLLQHLSGNTTKPANTMGNHPSDLQNGSSRKGLQWPNGPRNAYGDPPEFLVKLAKVIGRFV